MKSREIIEKLYGPIKTQGQKKLEDFKKKGIVKPEKPKTLTDTIIAKDQEGKETEFNLEQIKEYWISFYEENNLPEIAEEIKQTDIILTDEQIEQLKSKAEQGFNRFMLMPSIETLEQQLQNIKEQTEKPIKGLNDDQQYVDKGTWLSDFVKDNLDHIQTNNRPDNKPYLIFIKDNPQVDPETVNKSPQELRETLKQKKETGLTLQEYLIFQRDYTQRHINEEKAHPDDFGGNGKATWLLDSELDQNSSGPGHVLVVHWSPDYRQVRVNSDPADDSSSHRGARSSAIFEI